MVADLTTANANVFYELGLRHAVRAWSTVLVFAEGGSRLPFDVAPLRALPYRLTSGGTPDEVDSTRAVLSARLQEARRESTDSPVFQLVEGFPDIQRLKTDVFREQVRYSQTMKEKLAAARERGVEAVRAVEAELGSLTDAESGVVIDLFLSYRAAKAWADMIALVDRMPRPLAATVMVREQLGLALNRAGRSEEAERTLLAVIDERGPSSETYGRSARRRARERARFMGARDHGAQPAPDPRGAGAPQRACPLGARGGGRSRAESHERMTAQWAADRWPQRSKAPKADQDLQHLPPLSARPRPG
ncbi:MAG TPA: TRAFs-binding domain-containing protein [Vicinamibacteria bacterium]|nr:TRAFs-binding domain-containing protein [Vicinamibacteria bacterium]